MVIEKNLFRQVMGHFTTGVTIVTTHSSTGPTGMTANAFCSVSLEPPLVLICIDLKSVTLNTIRESGAFAVNILSSWQEDLSRCFASSSEERYEYWDHTRYRTAITGSPVLNDTLSFVDTRVVTEYPGGDHVIFLGEVVAMGIGNDLVIVNNVEPPHSILNPQSPKELDHFDDPLLYYRGRYQHLIPKNEQPHTEVTHPLIENIRTVQPAIRPQSMSHSKKRNYAYRERNQVS